MISFYIPGPSWLHSVPASVKLMALAITSILILPLDDLLTMGAFVGVCFLITASIGREAIHKMSLLRPLIPLLIIIMVLHAWQGTLLQGGIVVLRLMGMILLANVVTMTTRMSDMMAAIEPILRPLAIFGLSPKRLSLAVALLLRFVPVLFEVWHEIDEAHRARSGKKGGWRLLAPFCIHTLKMAEAVSEALVSRGGSVGFPSPHKKS